MKALIIIISLFMCTIAVVGMHASGSQEDRSLEPLAPTGSVGVLSEIGSVASADNRIEVSVVAKLNADQRFRGVQVNDKGILGATVLVSVDDLMPIANALDKASESAVQRRTFERTTNNVRVTGEGGSVEIRSMSDRIRISRDRIEFDADNAAMLAQLFRRGFQNIQWLNPRLDALDPSVDVQEEEW